jgi:hypothetical protein
VLLAEDAQKAVPGLGQRREGLEGLEGGGQPAAVALSLRRCCGRRSRVRHRAELRLHALIVLDA